MSLRSRMPCRRGLLALLILASFVFLGVNVMFLWNQVPLQPCICNCIDGTDSYRKQSGASAREDDPFSISPVVETVRTTNETKAVMSTEMKTAAATTLESIPPETSKTEIEDFYGPHHLSVVVPFRNRYEEMMEFVPYLHQFLERQRVRHQIWVINQADKHRFNRASLLNIGFLLSRNECDYMAMHDIDLLPLNDDLRYSYPELGPLHVSSPELHPLYHYKTFVGGILIMSRIQFEQVNGLSNLFWGWGREDDELYLRMKEAKMTVQYPKGIKTGYKTFRHIHDREKHPRDQKRYYNQWEISRRRDKNTGLNTLKYSIVSSINMTIDGAPFHFVNVDLECDYKATPFCDAPD